MAETSVEAQVKANPPDEWTISTPANGKLMYEGAIKKLQDNIETVAKAVDNLPTDPESKVQPKLHALSALPFGSIENITIPDMDCTLAEAPIIPLYYHGTNKRVTIKPHTMFFGTVHIRYVYNDGRDRTTLVVYIGNPEGQAVATQPEIVSNIERGNTTLSCNVFYVNETDSPEYISVQGGRSDGSNPAHFVRQEKSVDIDGCLISLDGRYMNHEN